MAFTRYLVRRAASSFVNGYAGSLGRRLGSYSRRRRVVAPRSRAYNIRRSKTYAKKTKVVRGTRNIRQLWKAVRKLQRTSDPDVTFNDILPTTFSITNRMNNGFASVYVHDKLASNTPSTVNSFVGEQYRIKSYNEDLTFTLSSLMNGNNATAFPEHFVRHVRVLYVLLRDEYVDPGDLPASIFTTFDDSVEATTPTIYPPMHQNIPFTFRILYDKTFSVRSGAVTHARVVIPASVFYNKGIVKFNQNSSNQLVQANNFLYRIMIADSVPSTAYFTQGTSANPLSLYINELSRWKYYDNGGSRITAAATQALAAKEPVQIEQQATDT